MSIKKIIEFNGTMIVKSGVHIGGTDAGTKVGGSDNSVIRNPLTNDPYIPGSSIKGALRSAAEKMPEYAQRVANGAPCGCARPDCLVCKMFGAHMKTKPASGEPRLIVRDMNLNPDFLDKITLSGGSRSDIIEVKTSTMIDRRYNTVYSGDEDSKGRSKGGSFRNMERVAAGTVFDCSFTIKVMKEDKEEDLINFLKKLLSILEATGIGGKVTSGSGQVEFDIDWKHPNKITL